MRRSYSKQRGTPQPVFPLTALDRSWRNLMNGVNRAGLVLEPSGYSPESVFFEMLGLIRQGEMNWVELRPILFRWLNIGELQLYRA